nr:NDP-hexose 2,3-dehydratase family protein [Streptomyces sp. NBC_00857]
MSGDRTGGTGAGGTGPEGRICSAPFLRRRAGYEDGRHRTRTTTGHESGTGFEAGAEIPVDCPPGFRRASFGQLTELLAHGNYLNVEPRTLITRAHNS